MNLGASAKHNAYVPLGAPSTPPGKLMATSSAALTTPPYVYGAVLAGSAAAAAPALLLAVLATKTTTLPATMPCVPEREMTYGVACVTVIEWSGGGLPSSMSNMMWGGGVGGGDGGGGDGEGGGGEGEV